MTITTTLPSTMPNRSMTREEYVAAWDALLAALPDFASETDLAVAAFNFNATNSTSTTSDTIATGSTTITVQASKSYVVGMTVKIAYTTDATNWMLGEVTAYDSGTGSLTVYVRTKNGSGTYTAWTVSLAATSADVGDLVCTCITGNGSGSTLTTVRLLTTTQVNTLGAVVTHSATNGTSIELVEAGLYEVFAQDHYTGSTPASIYWGVGKNITTGIATPGNTGTLCLTAPGSGGVSTISRVFYGAAGDVIRLMNNGNYYNGVDYVILSVRKIQNG